MLKTSLAGRTFIEGFEDCALRAYRCPAGVLTIGYGHTLGVKPGDVLPNVAAADALLSADLASFEAELNRLLAGVATTQHQFDAMLSLEFNIGVDNFSGSTVLKMHKAADYAASAAAFHLWCNALVDGQLEPLPGLVRRRSAEAVVYLTANDDEHPMPAPVSLAPMARAIGAPAGMLSVGMSGDQVATLETKLEALGLYAGAIDGDFGPATRTAVVAFQRRRNLMVDGIVGPETWSALEKAAA